MHELGVVFYVIKDVVKVATDNNVKQVNSVTLEIGEVSGIIHDYLIDCWNWARKKEDILKEAELKIETIKAKTFCENCETNYDTVKHAKICPNCGSDKTYLITGNEFMIKEIAVPDDTSDDTSDDTPYNTPDNTTATTNQDAKLIINQEHSNG